jgi:stage V sporulation protein S
VSADGPLKVSAKSSPNAVAGALAATLRERESAELQAVGAGAINQAIKAVAIARNYLKAASIDVVCVPAFITVAISDNERTGISLLVERRSYVAASEPSLEAPQEASHEPSTMLLPTETLA